MTRIMSWPHIFQAIGAILLLWFILWFFAPEVKAQNVVWHGYVPPVNVSWEILAIAGAEDWDEKERPIGDAGERGRLQFTPERWAELSSKPHRWADSRQWFAIKETHRVEIVHILDLIEKCKKLHRNATPYLVAAIHAAGYDAVASGHISAFKKDFAERAAAIYHELEINP